MKPVIGITCDLRKTGKETEYFLEEKYRRAIEENAGIPLTLIPTRNTDEIIDKINGLLITGSKPDIDPAIYNEPQLFKFKTVDSIRSNFEISIIRKAIKKIPVLGICGGAQMVNVALGGTLYQDIKKLVEKSIKHRNYVKHEVKILKGTKLYKIIKKSNIIVNSAHHQAIKSIPDGFRISAISSDGIIEAIESIYPGFPNGAHVVKSGYDNKFTIGIQWHPELLTNIKSHRLIFENFIRASK